MEQFHFTDPTSFDSERCIFDVPLTLVNAMHPDIQISNLGILFTPDADPTKEQKANYPSNLGVKAMIKNITIKMNDQIAEQLREFNNILGFENLVGKNGSALDINAQLEKSNRSYARRLITAGASKKLDNQDYSLHPNIDATRDKILDMSVANNTGIISLLDYSQLLNSFLNAGAMIFLKYIFLRIEIEWETDITKYALSFAGGNAPLPSQFNFTAYKPVLITKRFNDSATLDDTEKMYNRGFSLPYTSWHTERLTLNNVSIADLTTKIAPTNAVLRSVKNKRVVKAVVQTVTPATNQDLFAKDQHQLGKFYSVGNNNEYLKINLNGGQFIPFEGIDRPSLKRLYRDFAMIGQDLLLVQGCDVGLWNTSSANNLNYLVNIGAQSQLQSYFVIPFYSVLVDTLDVEYGCYSSSQLPVAGVQTQLWHFETHRIFSCKQGIIMIADDVGGMKSNSPNGQ